MTASIEFPVFNDDLRSMQDLVVNLQKELHLRCGIRPPLHVKLGNGDVVQILPYTPGRGTSEHLAMVRECFERYEQELAKCKANHPSTQPRLEGIVSE